ncbi:hypothetical protein NQ317_000089, partial [Molorchus minor]
MLLECLAILIGSVGIVYSLKYLKNSFRSKKLIWMLPGPKKDPLLGHLKEFLLCDDATLFRKLRKWAREFYPVYNLCPSMLVIAGNISGAEDFELVASTTKNIGKGPIYTVFDRWLGNGLLTSTGEHWQTRRKILTPAFHFKILQQFVTIFNKETNNLVEVLRKECNKPETNIMPFITQFTLYSINETSMGVKLRSDNEEDKSYCSAVHKIGHLMYQRVIKPWLYFHIPYYYMIPSGIEERSLIKHLHNFTNKVIKERSQNFKKFELPEDTDFNYSQTKKMAMLDILLNAKENGLVDDEGIQNEVNTFMFEAHRAFVSGLFYMRSKGQLGVYGHDTTSMAICFTIMLLASHRDVQELILQEINQILGESNDQPTFNELQELKYLERCIKECLRIYPSVPFLSRVLEEDVVTSVGYTLPKGAIINIHIYDIHRDPKVYPDPEKFDPDRFLPENCQNRHPFAYGKLWDLSKVVISHFVSQRFAILEMKAVLCGILRNFILEPVDTPETINLVPAIVLRPEGGVIRKAFADSMGTFFLFCPKEPHPMPRQ